MSPWQVLLTLSLVVTVLGVAMAVLTLTLTDSSVCTLLRLQPHLPHPLVL